jgi:leucyl aminopeptidase
LAERPAALTFTIATRFPAADVIAIPVLPGAKRAVPGPGADGLERLGVDARAALRRDEATGEAGEVIAVPAGPRGAKTVLLAGIGDGSPRALRRAAAAVVRRAKAGTSLATSLAAGSDPAALRAVVEGLGLAAYAFSRKSEPKPLTLRRAVLVVDAPAAPARAAVARGIATVEAVRLARDLANTPSLEKSPQWMVEQCRDVAERSGLSIDVWDAKRLARDGFGGILAVGRGSVRPPALVRLEHRPEGASRHVVLVGKGITFDSGGLSLKSGEGMVAMKTDMSGAAAVVAAMSALPALGVGVRVTALLPFAENMPGGDAIRPGDVIRHYGGRTTEVLNTDAEGRLVLADALAYATAELAPDALVDIATLTGAATQGLGRRHAALFATSAGLSDELVAAGEAGGERLWPMPLVEDYRDALDSSVADARNIADPSSRYGGGAIMAALFLREFVGATAGHSVPWAHLDVAGPARADADEDEITKGATGFGVRTFLRWLEAATA